MGILDRLKSAASSVMGLFRRQQKRRDREQELLQREELRNEKSQARSRARKARLGKLPAMPAPPVSPPAAIQKPDAPEARPVNFPELPEPPDVTRATMPEEIADRVVQQKAADQWNFDTAEAPERVQPEQQESPREAVQSLPNQNQPEPLGGPSWQASPLPDSTARGQAPTALPSEPVSSTAARQLPTGKTSAGKKPTPLHQPSPDVEPVFPATLEQVPSLVAAPGARAGIGAQGRGGDLSATVGQSLQLLEEIKTISTEIKEIVKQIKAELPKAGGLV